MGSIQKTPLLFHDKPLFGLDIGRSSIKVVQLDIEHPKKSHEKHHPAKPQPTLVGYGTADFDASAIEDGVVVKPELIAAAAKELFSKNLIGDITTRRVAMALPSYRTFTRSMELPLLKKDSERAQAVQLEAEQYLPMPLSEMYLDYTPIQQTKDTLEVLVVAVPKKIVDSYLNLTAIMGLEPVLIETTMNAAARMFEQDPQSDVTSVIIDFGTVSSDISIYDRGIVTAGTVEGGGQVFTEIIKEALGVSLAEAMIIKTKYGLSRSRRQAEIQAALDPTLQKVVKEIKRLMRYHDEHYGTERPIKQVITLGGGANMPGMSEYFINHLRSAVRSTDPWQYINFGHLQPPAVSDRPMYATATGLSLIDAKKVFK